MEYYSAIKKNKSESVLARGMNLEPIIQSEVNQKEKKQTSYINPYIWYLENGINKPICRVRIETQT